jgi:hypothetical protein
VRDEFLEEQLRRVRRLTEKMAEAHDQVRKNTERMSRDREAVGEDSLHPVRSYEPRPSASSKPGRRRRR